MIVPIFRLVSLLCHSKAVTAAAAATPRWCSPGRARWKPGPFTGSSDSLVKWIIVPLIRRINWLCIERHLRDLETEWQMKKQAHVDLLSQELQGPCSQPTSHWLVAVGPPLARPLPPTVTGVRTVPTALRFLPRGRRRPMPWARSPACAVHPGTPRGLGRRG